MDRVVILGAGSLVGQALTNVLRREFLGEVILYTNNNAFTDLLGSNVTFRNLTLNEKELKENLILDAPNYIINCVGYSNVLDNELNNELSIELNVKFVETIVNIAQVLSSHLIMFSTDNVFDGKTGYYSENDIPNPINFFGKTKLAAENIINQSFIKSTILRINNVFGLSFTKRNDLFNFVVSSLERDEAVYLPDFIIYNPTFSDDIARLILDVLDYKVTGLFHVGCQEHLSSYDFAKEIAKIFGKDINLVRKISRDALNKQVKYIEKGGFITLKAETNFMKKFATIHDSITSIKFQIESSKKQNRGY